MQVEPAAGKCFEPRAEAPKRFPRILGNTLEYAPVEGKEGDELVRLAQIHAAYDDGFGLGFHRLSRKRRLAADLCM